MSEQTPGPAPKAADDQALMSGEDEPSMEDILASIRKIISDDADPVPLDGPDMDATDTAATDTTTTDTASTDDTLDIDALMDDLDVVTADTPQPSSLADSLGLGEASPTDDGLAIPEIETETASVTAPAPDTPSDDDDMGQLMDELLSSMADTDDEPAPSGPIAATMPAGETSEDEMDAVKSMLADLTDDDVSTAAVSDDDAFDMNALINEFDAQDEAQETPDVKEATDAGSDAETSASDSNDTDADTLDAMEEDIFDSILDMTLDDEVAAFDAAAEADGSAPSLADIAAAADAEADVETAPVAASVTVKTDPSAAKPAKPAPTNPAPAEMETPMPSALRSDAILDDVTESATMSAFAELNQVVEDKAILSERGPRIGDLVQDALRPMLKEWLDENLQGIVERAVAKEVKRIATGK